MSIWGSNYHGNNGLIRKKKDPNNSGGNGDVDVEEIEGAPDQEEAEDIIDEIEKAQERHQEGAEQEFLDPCGCW